MFFDYDDYMDAWRATGRAGARRRGDAGRRRPVRRMEGRVPAPRRRGLHPTARLGQGRRSRARRTGTPTRSRVGAKRLLRIGKASGGTYLGDEISQGDWASRHDRYATPQHGRTRDGQVALMSWHCEDAAIPYPELPAVREKWHAIARDLCERFDMFDDWGMFAYTNGAFKPWGDYLAEIDIGIWEMKWDDRDWAAWVDAKRELARVSIEHGGSISACHGSCREGEVDLVPEELGGGFEVMKTIKRALDPNNIMNPGQVPARPGLRGGVTMLGFRLSAEKPPEPERVNDVRRDALRARLRDRPGADDRARPPAGHPELGLQADRRQPLGAPRLDARPLRRLGALGRGAARGDRSRGLTAG